MTVVELKARAYDILATIEKLQAELRQTNQLIVNKLREAENGLGETIGCKRDAEEATEGAEQTA